MTDEQPVTAQPKTFNLVELSNYVVDFQVIQLPTKPWVFALQIYPQSEDDGFIEDLDFVEGMGIANKIKGVNAVVMYSRESYSQWEYAAESAIDVIETLGFTVDAAEKHTFRVVFFDDVTRQHVTKPAAFQDNEVRLVKNDSTI